MQWEYETKPEKCPLCGATKLAEIRYGLIKLTPELKKEIDDGIGRMFIPPCIDKMVM